MPPSAWPAVLAILAPEVLRGLAPRRSSAFRGVGGGEGAVLGGAASAVAGAAARAVGTRGSASWEEGRAGRPGRTGWGCHPAAARLAAGRRGVCPPLGSGGAFDSPGLVGRSRPPSTCLALGRNHPV